MNREQSSVSTERLVKLLGNHRRRAVLEHLREYGSEPLPVDDLAESLATRRLRSDEEELAIRLGHVDLPMLADADVVEYDPESATVDCSSQEQLGKLLQFVDEDLE